MDAYLRHCCRLAWKMYIQQPNMEFRDQHRCTKWSSPTDVELTYESMPYHPNASVKYYRYPSLYHDDRCLVKGMVHVE